VAPARGGPPPESRAEPPSRRRQAPRREGSRSARYPPAASHHRHRHRPSLARLLVCWREGRGGRESSIQNRKHVTLRAERARGTKRNETKRFGSDGWTDGWRSSSLRPCDAAAALSWGSSRQTLTLSAAAQGRRRLSFPSGGDGPKPKGEGERGRCGALEWDPS